MVKVEPLMKHQGILKEFRYTAEDGKDKLFSVRLYDEGHDLQEKVQKTKANGFCASTPLKRYLIDIEELCGSPPDTVLELVSDKWVAYAG